MQYCEKCCAGFDAMNRCACPHKPSDRLELLMREYETERAVFKLAEAEYDCRKILSEQQKAMEKMKEIAVDAMEELRFLKNETTHP